MGVAPMQNKYKLMAFHRSTGLWDTFHQIRLCRILGRHDDELEAELAAWQEDYDNQFRRHPYDFDWAAFNRQGVGLPEKIQSGPPHGVGIYYVESDDRDFFNPEDCTGELVITDLNSPVKSYRT